MPNRNDSYLGRPAGDASQYLKPKSHEIIKPAAAPAEPHSSAKASATAEPAKAASWASAAPAVPIVALSKSLAHDLGPNYRWQNIAERIEEATETRETAAELERVKQLNSELLAALKALLMINAIDAVIKHAELNNMTTPAYERVQAARAAIAAAEERAQS